jgi:hypothetical protein
MSVRAVLAVWSLALLAAVGAVALILASDRPRPVASIPLEVLVGLAFVGSGLLARMRRPENRTGLLMILVGFAWFGGALTAADRSLPYTIGYVDGALIGAFFVHLVLAFPSGRLETKTERRVAAGMYVFALVLQPALLLFDDLHGLKCDACPANAFLVDRNETLAVVLGLPTLAFVLGLLVGVVVILVRRWRAATAPLRGCSRRWRCARTPSPARSDGGDGRRRIWRPRTRWPVRAMRPSFLTSMWISSPGRSRS